MVTKDKTSFSERELELINIAFQCCSSKPDIDYELMATKAGLKGAKSARDTFGPIWKKLTIAQPTDATTTTESGEEIKEPVSGKKKAAPKKRKSPDNAEDGTPTKKKATPRKVRKTSVSEEKEGSNGGEELIGETTQTLGGESIVKAEDGEDDFTA